MLGNILKHPMQLLMTAYIKSPIKSRILMQILKKEPIAISGIKQELEKEGEAYNYRTIWQHVQSLSLSGSVVLKKEEHQAGKPVRAYLSPYIRENKKEFKNFLEIALDEKKREQFEKETELKQKQFLKELEDRK